MIINQTVHETVFFMKNFIERLLRDYPITSCSILIILISFFFVQIRSIYSVALKGTNILLEWFDKFPINTGEINFSLGEAVAALGLIFTVLQLLNKRREIVLNIKGGFAKKIWWVFVVLGLISILLSVLFQSKSLLLEIVGFLFFVLSPFVLWIAANTTTFFGRGNAKRFYHILLRTASTGKQEDLEIVITLLLRNLDKLTEAVRQTDSLVRDREVPAEKLHCVYAQELLNTVLSDKQMADYIVTTRIDFLFSFLDMVKEKRLSRDTLGTAVEKLIDRLFENTESFLFKQLTWDGFSLYAPVYDTIFGDLYFINGFSVLKVWAHNIRGLNDYTEKKIAVFLKALEKSVEASKFQDYSACQEIAYMLHELVDCTRSLTWGRKKEPELWEPAIGKIEFFFGHTFPNAYRDALTNNTVSEYELKAEKGETYRQSLTATYAKTLVEFLGQLALIDDPVLERDRAMSATREILSITDNENTFVNIRECFFGFMWDQIEDNTKRGHFPPTLRIHIELFSWKGKNIASWYLEERKKLIKYLYQELSPRILKSEKMANYKDLKEKELLPEYVTYNKRNKSYFITQFNGSKIKLK